MMNVVTFIASSLGAIFLTAGLAKAFRPESLKLFLSALGVPSLLARVGSLTILLLELFIGTWLIVGVFRVSAVFVATGISIVFVFVQLLGHHFEAGQCRCFGVLDSDDAGRLPLIRSLLVAGAGATLCALTLSTDVDYGTATLIAEPTTTVFGVLAGIAVPIESALARQFFTFQSGRPRPIPNVQENLGLEVA